MVGDMSPVAGFETRRRLAGMTSKPTCPQQIYVSPNPSQAASTEETGKSDLWRLCINFEPASSVCAVVYVMWTKCTTDKHHHFLGRQSTALSEHHIVTKS
jgi:hypothetical protein